MKTLYVHTQTLEEFTSLMEWCKEHNIRWQAGEEATSRLVYWDDHKANTVIDIPAKYESGLFYGSWRYNADCYNEIITLNDFFLLKGVVTEQTVATPIYWPF